MRPDELETVAVVLAAGRGTRMRSETPKVLHRLSNRPLLEWVLEAARGCGCERILCVVGHGADRVRDAMDAADVSWVDQREQLGTGHALAQTKAHIGGLEACRLLVLSGDVPLVTAATLERLLAVAEGRWGAMAVADHQSPGGLGRVLARSDSTLERIVEAADATPEELAVQTVNAGIYVLPSPGVFAYLETLEADNAKGEFYLTDALNAAAAGGADIALMRLDDPDEALGVNQRADLVRARKALAARRATELLAAGVTVWDPERVWIEPRVEIGRDTEIHPGVTLLGTTRVGEGCVLHPGVWARDCRIGDGAVLEPYSVLDGAEIGPRAKVGPFARLRPGTVLGAETRIGNFVEVKNSRLAESVKAGHLTYLGDADIGPSVNVGAGTVTCNYDGEAKHQTEIGAGAFIGSDTMLVAPLRVGKDAVTAAGSVITQDVPDGALGVGRGRQRNIEQWAKRKKKARD